MRAVEQIHLYWVTVPYDPSEDWFVFAVEPRSARAFFEEYEGFEAGEAETRLIESNVHSKQCEGGGPCWAQLADLKALGFEIMSRSNPRVVRRRGETFVEGYLQSEIVQSRDDFAEAGGRGRPHGTRRPGKPN